MGKKRRLKEDESDSSDDDDDSEEEARRKRIMATDVAVSSMYLRPSHRPRSGAIDDSSKVHGIVGHVPIDTFSRPSTVFIITVIIIIMIVIQQQLTLEWGYDIHITGNRPSDNPAVKDYDPTLAKTLDGVLAKQIEFEDSVWDPPTKRTNTESKTKDTNESSNPDSPCDGDVLRILRDADVFQSSLLDEHRQATGKGKKKEKTEKSKGGGKEKKRKAKKHKDTKKKDKKKKSKSSSSNSDVLQGVVVTIDNLAIP